MSFLLTQSSKWHEEWTREIDKLSHWTLISTTTTEFSVELGAHWIPAPPGTEVGGGHSALQPMAVTLQG